MGWDEVQKQSPAASNRQAYENRMRAMASSSARRIPRKEQRDDTYCWGYHHNHDQSAAILYDGISCDTSLGSLHNSSLEEEAATASLVVGVGSVAWAR